MMLICDNDKCSGCSACYNICPRNCITMSEDSYGETKPQIDESRCVKCNLCKNICPNNKQPMYRKNLECIAAYRKNDDARKDSASGGVGAVFEEVMIKRNGIVYGVKYNESMEPCFYRASKIEEIEGFKGSKYVEAIVNDAYKNVAFDLKNENTVLFVGTPCQISGLYNYLEIKKIESEKLFTCDLICHGVSPTAYFREELKYLSKNKRWKAITNISFRCNKKRMNFYFTVYSGNKKIYKRNAYAQYYFYGFMKGITLRTACYSCPYAKIDRVSDVTIGDFIGLGKTSVSPPFDGNAENTSVILINSEKGRDLFNNCSNELNYWFRNLEEAFEGCISLRQPFPKHKMAEVFRKAYKENGFSSAMRGLFRSKIFINSVLRYINFILKRIGKKLLPMA